MDRAYGNSFIASGGATDYNLHLYEATDASGTMTAYSNGTQIGTGGGQQGPNGLALGGHGAGGGSEGSYADIGEVLVFNRVLTAAERVQMEQYLQARWYGVLPSATTLSLTGSSATFDLGGVDQTVAALSGIAGSQIALNGGRLTAGSDNSSTTFSGAISDGSTSGGGLTKVGSGLLTLSGTSASSYTGATVIQQGSVALSKSAGVTAVPGDIVMLNSLSPNLWMTANGQLGGNGVLSFNNEVNTSFGNARFYLEGTTQSVAGISATDPYGNGVIQNSEPGVAGPNNTGTGTLVLAGAGNYSYYGYLRNATGTLAISKTGSGTQTFVGDRIDYTGSTTVTGGRLILSNNDDTWTSGYAISTGATVEVSRNTSADYEHRNNFTLSGAGTFEKTGNGMMDMNWDQGGTVAMSSGALIDVKGGTLRLGYGSISNWTNNRSDLNIEGGAKFDMWDNTTGVFVDALSGGGTFIKGTAYNNPGNGTLTLGVDNGGGTFSGTLQNGTGSPAGILSLTKTGTGTQTLSGANTYTGATTVNDGILILSGPASNGPNTFTVVNSGELRLGKAAGQNAVDSTQMNLGDGTGSANTAITRLLDDDQISSATTLAIYSDGLLILDGNNETITSLQDGFPAGGSIDGGSGNPTLAVHSGSFSGVIKNTSGSLTLVKTGASGEKLVLAGANTHTGDTVMSGTGGTLQLANFNALQNSTLDTGPAAAPTTVAFTAGTGTYNLGGLKGADNLGFAAGIGANTISVGFNGQSTTYAGVIAGTNGKLTKVGTGTLMLTGNNTYTGTTNVNAGKLLVNGTHQVAGVTNVGDYTVAAGATLGGTGTTDALIKGAGLGSPGNSPGIFTASQTDPSGGMDFAFELNQVGDPTWSNATASGNDVWRLTHASNPFPNGPFDSDNVIDIYLGFVSIAQYSVLRGGFFTDLDSDFLATVAGVDYNFWILGDGNGTATTFGGQGYYNMLNYTGLTLSVSTYQVPSANFAGGTINDGWVMEFTAAVPEPSTYGLALIGLVGLGMLGWRKRKASSYISRG